MANGMGLVKPKHTGAKQEAEKLAAAEKQHWRGNNTVDLLAKEAVEWHKTEAVMCTAMEKATAQKTKTIKAIGKFLAALPNARELYRGHVWTEEDEELLLIVRRNCSCGGCESLPLRCHLR